jgi:NADPH-dependent ferric siderophore reductase
VTVDDPTTVRARREPPRFRRVAVERVAPVTARMVRVTLAGDELVGLAVDEPAASVRLLLPSTPGGDLVVPAWSGNEFLLPDGRRPVIRTLTPLRADSGRGRLDVEIVVHGGGTASEWAQAASVGAPAAVSGPGRGYEVDTDAPAFAVLGDETAIPAIGQVLDALPPDAPVDVCVEVADPAAQQPLARPVAWSVLPAGAPPGATLVDAVAALDLAPGTRVWAAGEAASMQRIRRHLFDERAIPRDHTTVRGYWKHGRTATG